MDYSDLMSRIDALTLGAPASVVYPFVGGRALTIRRTNRFGPKDFVITFTTPTGSFDPRHTRLFRDLDRKRMLDSEAFGHVMEALERVNDGEDPERVAHEVGPHPVDGEEFSTLETLCLAQLFMAEQETNYGDVSKGLKWTYYSPPRNFFVYYLRWVASGTERIESLCRQAESKVRPPNHIVRFRRESME